VLLLDQNPLSPLLSSKNHDLFKELFLTYFVTNFRFATFEFFFSHLAKLATHSLSSNLLKSIDLSISIQ
jgi:hypothetical protein